MYTSFNHFTSPARWIFQGGILLLYFYIFIYFTKHHSDLLTLLLCPIGSCSCIYFLFLIYPLFYPGSISFIILSLFVRIETVTRIVSCGHFWRARFSVFTLYLSAKEWH